MFNRSSIVNISKYVVWSDATTWIKVDPGLTSLGSSKLLITVNQYK